MKAWRHVPREDAYDAGAAVQGRGDRPPAGPDGHSLPAPADPTPEEQIELQPLKDDAKQTFGLDDAPLEVVADSDADLHSSQDLVLGKDSPASRVAGTPFEGIPYCLSFMCDGCLKKPCSPSRER
jgi:hypothetical protein